MLKVTIDVEAATECFGREKFEEEMQQGMQQGENEGELLAFIKLYNNNLIKSTDATKILNISEDEFLKKAKEYNA